MNSITMSVDGFDFGKYMIINKLMRPSYATESQMAGETTSDGLDILYTRNTETKITIEATLLSDKENNYMSLDEINELIKSKLRSKKDRRIIFSDFPNRYWVGRIDGTDNLDYMSPKIGTLTIVFTIPKGISYAVNKKLFTAQPNADGILQMEVDNQGTEATLLSFNATINDDNGFLGAVTADGAMEFGKISEIDGYMDMSEWVFVDHLTAKTTPWFINTGTIEWQKSNAGNPNLIQGNIDFKNNRAYPSAWGTPPTDNRWYGPTLSRNIAAKTSDGRRDGNWRLRFWLVHKSNKDARKLGRQEINLSRNNTSSAVAFSIYDDVTGSNKTVVQLKILGEVKFGFKVNPNFTEFYGSVDIWKQGNTIFLRLYSADTQNTATYSYYDERYGALEFDKLTYWAARYRNYPICEMSFNYVDFQWVGTQKFIDVPNRYMTGDVLSYDGDSGKFYIDHGDGKVLSMNEIVQGSTDLMIPPGKHFVQFYYSEFSNVAPTIVGEIRERWL